LITRFNSKDGAIDRK